MSRHSKRLMISIVLAVAAVVLAVFLYSWYDESFSAEDSTVRAVVFRQPIPGFTDADLDQNFLLYLERESLTRSRGMIANDFDMRGGSERARVTSESAYNVVEGTKLAVIKIHADGIFSAATVGGIVGGDFVRVVCGTPVPTGKNIIIGNCSDAVTKEFGVSLDTPNG